MNTPILSDAAYFSDIDFVLIMNPDFRPEPNHPHRPNHGFAYSISSIVTYHFDTGLTLECRPQMLIYLPKGCSYYVECTQRGYCACINFQLKEDFAAAEPFCQPVTDPEAVERIYRLSLSAWMSQQKWSTARIRSCLYELQSMLIAQNDSPYYSSKHMEEIDATVRYIHEHYTTEDISVEKLVSMTDIGASYYRQLFKNKYGTTPVKYIQNLRIGYAKHLIQNSFCTVDSAAMMSGFSSSAYFCRQFRQLTGLTPGEYREQMHISKNGK